MKPLRPSTSNIIAAVLLLLMFIMAGGAGTLLVRSRSFGSARQIFLGILIIVPSFL